jgi:large subunit ribosomal protein L17
MQHNRAGRKLGRTTSHRRALFRNQLASLFTYERITTTLPKSKDLRPLAEKMVTLGKRGGLHARRLALKNLPDQAAVKKLFEEIAPRFKERVGGYTHILKLGRRPGDGAEMAIIEFVDYDFAQRQAEKKVAAKAAAEKKETLLDKAKKLVTGKGAGEKSEKAEKPEKAGVPAEGEEKTDKAEKKPKGVEKPRGIKGPRAPKGSGKKGGGTHGGTPQKVGS